MSRRELGTTVKSRLVESGETFAGAQVVCDPYHRRLVGLGFVERDCEVFDSLDDLGPLGAGGLVCVSDDPHVMYDAVRLLQGARGETPAYVVLVQHASLLDIVRDLEMIERSEDVAITSIAMRDGLSFVRLGAARAEDSSARDLVVGLVHGAEHGQASAAAQLVADAQEIDELRRQLSQATEKLAAAQSQPSVRAESEDARALESRLVAESKRLAALQRKYDALAGSRLGRLTLKRWEKKRRGNGER
ncbi:hypothetical protein ASG53_03135 [Sanguibacter sp. Leaf3]|nr:hypothetical protein ASG53_03135 [Sanguibacter sp. Leaf3]